MAFHDRTRSGFLLPADIEVAQRAFDRLCVERNLPPSCDEGMELAAVVIAFFQRGTTTEDELVAAISALITPGSAVAA